VTADLRTEDAKQQILRLADTADVVLEGFRPGVMEKMVWARDLRSRNPKLIYARLSAFGGNGPHGTRPGVDLMVAAESGMTTGMPTPTGSHRSSLSSWSTKPAPCAGAGVLPRCSTASATGCRRRAVAMYDVAVGLQANQLTMHLNKASPPPRRRQAGRAPNTRSARALALLTHRRTRSGGGRLPRHQRVRAQTLGEAMRDHRRPDLLTASGSSTSARAVNIPS